MSATLNYRKYVTPSLSTYPRLNHYNIAHIIKGIWVPLTPCTLAMLHHRHNHLVIVVMELVRLALTKGYHIRLWLGFDPAGHDRCKSRGSGSSLYHR